jgi:hypothetical protein
VKLKPVTLRYEGKVDRGCAMGKIFESEDEKLEEI